MFFIKDNQPIEFKFHEVSPNDNMTRGWVVHLIEAFVDGKEAGYIKVSYIPSARFDKEYSNILQYLEKLQGKDLILPKEFGFKHIQGDKWVNASDVLDTFPLYAQVYAIDMMTWPYHFEGKIDELKAVPESELHKIKRELMKGLEKKYKREFEEFKKFHKDKPLVDYIRVEPGFQRKHIGAALYETAARWLAKKGLKLYASGLQSKPAQAAWDWMRKEKSKNIGVEKHTKDRERTFLSYL